jgi:hypothetical protein
VQLLLGDVAELEEQSHLFVHRGLGDDLPAHHVRQLARRARLPIDLRQRFERAEIGRHAPGDFFQCARR